MSNEIKRKIRRLYRIFLDVSRKIGNQFKSLPPHFSQVVKEDDGCVEDVSDKVAVITGSARGIGYALAESFLREGYSVLINGRTKSGVEIAIKKLKTLSNKVDYFVGDVSTSQGAKELVQKSVDIFGGLDVLINNAASPGSDGLKLWELTDEQWEQTLDANVSGPFYCSRESIQYAQKSTKALRIINVSSGIVGHGALNLGVYNVSKTALDALTLSLDIDVQNSPISVVSIQPRSVGTAMTKAYFSFVDYQLLEDPHVVTPVFLYAASAPISEITGKSISDKAFSEDPKAEVNLGLPLSRMPSMDIHPDVYHLGKDQKKSGVYMRFLQNALGVYPSVKKVIEENLASPELYQYPDPYYTELRKDIAKELSIDGKDMLLGNGSSEIIIRAFATFRQQGGNVIVTRPTWESVIFQCLKMNDLQAIEVPCLGSLAENNIRHDLFGILNAINKHTRLIYLVNPCNPSGTVVDPTELKKFLYRVPRHITVLIDEAYINFCDPDKVFNLAAEYKYVSCKVIGLRTFSKFFSLSGFRVGYAYGNYETIEYLKRMSALFSVATISQLAARTALKDKEWQKKTYDHFRSERERMMKELSDMNIVCHSTQTNFMIMDCPIDRNTLRVDLMKKGLYLPNMHSELRCFGSNVAIYTLGTTEHNNIILEYLKGR